MNAIRGFTLLEVLVYIGLMGILLTVCASAFIGVMYSSNRANADAQLITYQLYVQAVLERTLNATPLIPPPAEIVSITKTPIQLAPTSLRSITVHVVLRTPVDGAWRYATSSFHLHPEIWK